RQPRRSRRRVPPAAYPAVGCPVPRERRARGRGVRHEGEQRPAVGGGCGQRGCPRWRTPGSGARRQSGARPGGTRLRPPGGGNRPHDLRLGARTAGPRARVARPRAGRPGRVHRAAAPRLAAEVSTLALVPLAVWAAIGALRRRADPALLGPAAVAALAALQLYPRPDFEHLTQVAPVLLPLGLRVWRRCVEVLSPA